MGEVVKVASGFDQADFSWLVKSASYDSPHNANFVQHLSESKKSILTTYCLLSQKPNVPIGNLSIVCFL